MIKIAVLCTRKLLLIIRQTTMTEVRKPKVLVTHSKTPEAGIRLLREKCDVIICEGLPDPTREEILTKSAGVDGILWANHERLNAEALDRAGPQLKVISTKSAGLDCVDIAEVKRRGIRLGHTPNVLNSAVADLAIGLMISAARRFREGFLKIVNDQWDKTDPLWMMGQDIKDSTVGIVGLGGIGQTIVKRLRGFDVGTVLYTGHTEKPQAKDLGAVFVSFDELLRRSDFVFAAVPLTNETQGMFNKTAFQKMKPNCVFVNVARGGVVVQEDLVEALQNGSIFSAGLDVMVPEPLPKDHVLTTLQNCVLVPHLGTATERTENSMATVAANNILNVLEGKQLVSSAFEL